jgi:carboxyl-terminal processing protease
MFKSTRQFIYLPLIFSFILIIGILLGSYLKVPVLNKNKHILYHEKQDNKINEIIDYINQAYVDSTSYKELEKKAISGMLQSLDPHSEYIPASEYNEMNDQLQGKFEGIGVQFRIEKDTIVIINTISGGPSEKIGIMAGDRIILIDGKKFTGKKITNEMVMKNLKGQKDSKVKVSVIRRGFHNPIDFTITRGVIPTYSVDAAYIITDHIGYIKLSKFSATTNEEFKKALLSLISQGLQKLILDLRGNGGGYLESAIEVADELLPSKNLIVYTHGRHSPRKEVFTTGNGSFESKPLIILIDDWSASSSEIVTGAIQDNDRGLVIGRRSFGKGLVQEQLKLKDGSAIRLTIARYYTPTGRCIQKPYKNGAEDYYNKFYERFINGELNDSDSIHLNKSLKYKTPKGKIVYGGGGIMPDIYIPVKKSDFPEFYTKVLNKGLIFQYAFNYVDKNRNELKKFKNELSFEKDFIINDRVLNDFIYYATKNGLKNDSQDNKESYKYLKIQLKANIARNIFNEETYLKLINPIDKTINKALDVLQKEHIKSRKTF